MPQINANLTLNTAQAQASFDQFVRSINTNRLGQPLGRISGDAAEFNKSMQAATARVTAFGLSAGAILQVKNAIVAAATATIEVDKQLIELNTFLGQSTTELDKFSKSLFQIAKSTAAPFSDAAGAAKEFARQGLSANEVLERTGAALTLARISGLGYQDSVQGITTAINSFGKEALKATEITNKLIAVDTRFAVSSADLNEAIRRVGSSAEESGVGIDSLVAAVTAAQQTTGRGGAVIGNALKTIFTRLQRPEVLGQLEQLGVAVRDQNGFLLDGIGILKNYSDATKNLSQSEKSRTAELIGGIYQINQLNALIKDLSSSNSVYANSLSISNSATDEAKKKNEELNKSLSATLQSIKTTATEAASSLGSSFLRPIVEIGSSVSEKLLELVNPSGVGSELGTQIVKGLAGALGEGLSKTALPLLGSLAGLLAIKMGSFGKTAFKELGKASGDIFTSQKELALQQRINEVVGKNPGIISQINAGKITQKQAENEILNIILKQNQQLQMQAGLSGRTFSSVMQAAPSKKRFGMFAGGRLPSAAQQEVAAAKAYGAKNPQPRVIEAKIQGKTQKVMVNSEEDVIPNFANTGETAIIPRYRKMQDIPRMSKGYVPNFAKGININDKIQDYTGEILKKEKVIETRDSLSLKPYVGKRVGLVRTGVGDATLVGYAKIGTPIKYETAEQFRADYPKHKVKEGSKFDFVNSKYGVKYGFPLSDVSPTKNIKITSRGNVAREIPNFATGYVPNFAQKISSAGTSQNQIPGLFTKFGAELGPRNIDIGGGKYEKGTNFLKKKFGIFSRVHDKYNRSEEFNNETSKQLYGSADTATVANVLNVIEEKSAREELLEFVSKSIKPGGSAYFSIHEKDKSGIGAPTSRGYQNNLRASAYLEEISKYFDITKKTGNIIVGTPIAKASGYVPNFAFSSMKAPASGDRKFVDPETYSYLRYKLSNDKKAIDLKFSKSELKGQGSQMFERLGKTARRMGLPVRSSNLSSQANDVLDITDASLARSGKYGIEEVLKVAFPQLIHRQKGSAKNTSLSVNVDDGLNHSNNELSGKNIFSAVSGFASEKYKGNAKLLRNSIIDGSFDISDAVTNFAAGRVPNFAKRRDVIERIGKEEIFARFQKHFEKGKDYQRFYEIHAEEYEKKGLSQEERRMHANITSAISPRLADYIAAQFSGPIFNRFMKTKSTNVDDYLDVQPAKKVSEHETLGGTGDMGRKGEIARSGNPRDRDDVRRFGLSKALRGLDLGSHDTAKTRHYARAILQDKTAFPIDTNVIQAILGGKTPTPKEAAKLISLANEFATLNKIETGASGLQAAIFKSNSKFAEQYSPDTVRSALSGIQGRSGGYVPNFAKILIAAKYYDGLKVGKAKGVEISKTGEVENVGREVFGGIGFSTSRIGKGFASAVRTTAPTSSLRKASQQAGVTKSIIVPVVASSAINDPVPDNLKTNEALLQQFLANHPQPKEVVASLSQQGFNVKSILRSHSGSEIKSIIDILSSNSFNKGILNKSANELKDPKLVKFFAPGGIKAKGPKGTYAFGSSIAEMQQGEYASKVPGKHKSYPILVFGKSGPAISKPINAEELFPGITNQKDEFFFASVQRFGSRVLDTDNPEHMELLGRLGYSQKILQQENLMAGGYIPNFALGQKHLNPDGKRRSRKESRSLARSSEETSAMSNAFKALNLERKKNKISISKSTFDHWSGKDQSIGLEKPYSRLSSREKQTNILSAYAHEMAHSSQLSGLKRMKGVHSEIFNKHYSRAGLGAGFDREFSLLQEQDAWKEGLRFIPRQFQSAYKAQANGHYKTYSPDGKPMFDAFGAPGYASGYIPNFAGLGSPLLKAYKSTLKTLKSGHVVLADRKQIEEEFGNADGLQGYYAFARSNAINAGSIVLNKEALNNNPITTGRLMAHEGTHKLIDLFDEGTIDKFYSDREAQRKIGLGPAGLAAKRKVEIPTRLSHRLATASMDFANRASSEVKNYFPSYERVAALPKAYSKANYLEEMIADGSLDTIKGRQMLSEYLGLSPRKLGKVDKLHRRLFRDSMDAVYRDPKFRPIPPSPRLATNPPSPRLATNYATVAEPPGTPFTRSASLASGYVPNFAKKMIGYHATASQNFGKQIDPSRSFGEGQGQGFYFWKNKELAKNHSKFLESLSGPFPTQGPNKIIAGKFDRQHIVPDYEEHTKEATAFLKKNQDLLSTLESGKASYIDREGIAIGAFESARVNPAYNTFTVQIATKSGAKRTSSLSFDSQEGNIGSGALLGPLFDALRSQHPERVRAFEEKLIDKGGTGFRYIGPKTKAFSRNIASGYIPNFASTFNAEKIKKMGGYVGQANKASAPGLYNILNRIGIPIELDNITKKGLTDTLSSKENKLKLYNFLKQEPIEITNYPDSYSEVKDGNHRFTLAQFAGIKNIPAKFEDSFSGGYVPNFSGLSDAISREKTALAQRGVPASQIMAHFDKGGNPIAVTNKIDEPNGLKDVPNFAIPRPLLRFLSTRGRGLANPVSGGSELFAGNLLTAVLNQLAENEKISPDTAIGASAVVPGGIGLANIARALTSKRGTPGQKLAAGLTGLGQVGFAGINAFSDKTNLQKRIDDKKYAEALDRSRTSFQNLTENTAELADTFAKLDAAYRDPQADPKTITKLAKKQQDLLNKISLKNPELGSKLASETNPEKRQAILEDSAKEAQRVRSVREESLKFLSAGGFSGKNASERVVDFFASAINAGNEEILNQDVSNAKPSDFQNILKKGGLNVEEFSKIFQTDELKQVFIEALKATQKVNNLSQEQAVAIKELSKPLTAKKQKIDDAREVRAAISGTLKEQLPELASFAGGFSRRAGISASSEAGLAIKRSETSVAFNNSLQGQLADAKFSTGLPASVRDRLMNIQSPSKETGKELENLKTLPGLSKEQIAGLDKLIDFNNQQNRKLESANKIASETKNIQLRFLALQEKLAFGGDIRSSIDPEARGESLSSAIRGPLTYQLGGLLGSKRTQVAGATDFLTDTIKKYPGLLQTKDGQEPADVQAVKRELAGLNANDMQRDLLKRANMAEMMGLGQTGSMLRSKAFDKNYLLESAGLKTNALFNSPEVPEEVRKAMDEYEKFNVKSVREFKGEENQLRGLEDLIAPIKQKITDTFTTESGLLAKAFKESLDKILGEKGITVNTANIFAGEVKQGDSKKEVASKEVENISRAYAGAIGLMPTGYSSNANGLTKYSSSIGDAVKREQTALASRGIMGVPNFAMAGINLERSPDLANASNPYGFGVTNSIDEKNGLRSLGMRSSGFVPNFALKDVQKMAEGIKDATKGYQEFEKDEALKSAASTAKGVSGLLGPFSEIFKSIKKQAPILSGIDPLMQSGELASEGNYVGSVAKAIEGLASTGSTLEKTSAGFQVGLRATGAADASTLGKYGGKLSGAASAAGLITEIATSKNNAIAEDASDIIFGKKTDGKTNVLGAGLNVASLGLTAASGPFGLGVATATLGYRTGNVIENKLGIGDKLGEVYAGGAASAIARNADKAIGGLSSKEAFASGLVGLRKDQLIQQADLLNKTAGYPEINRSAILAKSKNAEERKRESQNLLAGSAGAFVPNYAKSRIEELLERIYGPRADAPKPVIPSDPAPILGVSQKTMPFYPERLVNEQGGQSAKEAKLAKRRAARAARPAGPNTITGPNDFGKSTPPRSGGYSLGPELRAREATIPPPKPGLYSDGPRELTNEEILARTIREGKESKAATLAKRQGLIELERATRPAGPNPIFARTVKESRLDEIGASRYAQRKAELSKLASPIFDIALDPVKIKTMSAEDLQNRLKISKQPVNTAESALSKILASIRRNPSVAEKLQKMAPGIVNDNLNTLIQKTKDQVSGASEITDMGPNAKTIALGSNKFEKATKKYFEETAAKRAEMKMFAEADAARNVAPRAFSYEEMLNPKPAQPGRLEDLYGPNYGPKASAMENNYKDLSKEEVDKILAKKVSEIPKKPSGSLSMGGYGPPVTSTAPPSGGVPPSSSIISPKTSGVLNKLKGAGKSGLKGLGVLGSVAFGGLQAKESYDQAKEGNYVKSTIAGLSSAASFAGLIKGAGKVAGPAGVALGALTDLESDLTLAKDFNDILGRKKRTYSIGPDGKIKEDIEPIGIGDIIGTAIGAITAAPVTAGILGYRTGNVIENKYGLGEKLGNFTSGLFSGGESLARLQESGKPIRGMTSKEAYDSDQILTRKMELVKEINKYNRAAGNPEISVGENILKSKKAQKRKDEADISALQEKLDKENKATKAGIIARATAAGAAETGILNKKSTEEEEARRTKLRRSIIESFEKNADPNRFQTTKDKVEYFLSLERQLNQETDPNGFGTFKPTDFKDPEFANSFNTYRNSKEKEAAREAKRVFPKPTEEFKNRPPQQSFPDDVLQEAVRTGRSAEKVMQDREDEKIAKGLIPPVALPSQTEIRNRPDPFTKDVLLEAARRRVSAEKIIQERDAEKARKDALPLLPPTLQAEIAIIAGSGSLMPRPLPSKIQAIEDLDPKNKPLLDPNKPDSYPADVVAEAIRTGRKPEQVIKDREQGIQSTDIPGGYTKAIIDEAMNRRGLAPQQESRGTGLPDFPKDVLEEAIRRRVTAEQVMRERAGGAVPNFAAMSNSMMSSGDVYSRMRATSSRSSMGGYSGGHVPNFAAGDFTDAISEAMKNGITSAFPNGGSTSSVSNSNVINIDGRTSIQNASDDAMQGIIGILFDKFPELKKLGPSALNFKR